MKYKLHYISTFYADISQTADYLAKYPVKAARVFAKIDKTLSSLRDMPEVYPAYRDAPRFRFFLAEDYLVLYKVNKPDAIIEVHRLLGGRMDILARLNG